MLPANSNSRVIPNSSSPSSSSRSRAAAVRSHIRRQLQLAAAVVAAVVVAVATASLISSHCFSCSLTSRVHRRPSQCTTSAAQAPHTGEVVLVDRDGQG